MKTREKYVKLAKRSWVMFVSSMLLGILAVIFDKIGIGKANLITIIVGLSFIILIYYGLLCGFRALIKTKKFGRKGILIPALIGFILNGIIALPLTINIIIIFLKNTIKFH